MAARKGTNILVWVLMAMLIVGLGGFGISNFGGSARVIGTVGTVDITVDDYARSFDSARQAAAVDGVPLSVAAARAQGIADQVLAQLVTGAALDNEAREIGLSVGDAVLQEELRAAPAFAGPDGGFSRQAYDFWLDNRGMTAPVFEAALRADIARGLLIDAVSGGVAPRDAYTNLILGFIGETRDFIWAPVTPDLLVEPVPDPTEADIEAWYQAHPGDFTAPETRQVTYAALTPEMLIARMVPDEDALRAAYAARADIYNIPERRLVERLVFSDMAAAEAARAAIDAGETDFAALAAERGLTLEDLDLGDIRRVDLAAAAGDSVFGLAEPGIAGPVESALGPALFRVNAILAPQVTPFEAVRDELATTVLRADAEAKIVDLREGIQDMLAGGATLEDLAADTDMEVAHIDFTGDETDAPVADPAFRDAALGAAPGDFPELLELGDGGLFALRVDAIVPPTLRPLDTVRDAVAAAWRADAAAQKLAELGASLLAQLDAGAGFITLGLEARDERGLPRDRLPAGAPPDLMATVFTLAPGAAALVTGPDGAALVRLNAVTPPDPGNPQLAQLGDLLSQSAMRGRANDMTVLFAEAVRARTETRIDPGVISAVESQLR